jgi:hypothetical protein
MLELVQKMTLKIRSKYSQYWIRTSNVQANLVLIKYLEIYPLFSSKHLDFIYWTKIFNLILEKNIEIIYLQ